MRRSSNVPFRRIGTQEMVLEEDEHSVEEEQKQENQKKEKQLEQAREKLHKRDFLVNTGFTFEITDYFKFEMKDEELKQKSFFKHFLQKNYLSWLVLFWSVLSTGCIPPWLMSIKANKLLRISWRSLLQLFILIPFVYFEKRTANEQVAAKYQLSHIFKPKCIRKIFIAAFMTTFFVSTILTSIEWTYISHCLVLGSLSNFFLSVERTASGKKNQLESGGQTFIILGFLLILYDSITLDVTAVPKQAWNYYNYFYLTREWWQRAIADTCAFGVAYVMSQLSKQVADLKEYYPPYLSMLLTNICTYIFTTFSAYFINGATFDFDSQYGVFALFSQKHFNGFFVMSIFLGWGVFVSLVMVSKMFPDPIVPALAMTFDPIISTILFQLVGVQVMPGSFACIGYILIIPGSMIILIGNCLNTRRKDLIEKKAKDKEFNIELKKVQMGEQKQKKTRFVQR